MNNIEQNALRIAELKDAIGDVTDRRELIEFFSSYDGLMPLVFECNKSELDMTIDIDMNDVIVTQYKSNHKNIFTYGIYQENEFIKSENTFIEAIQLAVIKYLELKS